MRPSGSHKKNSIRCAVIAAGPDGVNAADLVKLTGIGRNSIYRWLKELLEEGEVHIDRFAKTLHPGKPAALYLAGPASAGASTLEPHRKDRKRFRNQAADQDQSRILPQPAEDYPPRMRRHAINPGRHYLTKALFEKLN